MNNINVFLCQSDKERHVRIGEISILPILKLFRQTCWITSWLIEVTQHGGSLRSPAMQTGQGQWGAKVSGSLIPGVASDKIYLVADFWWNVSLDESGVVEIPQ